MEKLFSEIQNAAKVIATPNCATWMSAVAALGAVIVAVIVAVKQNKIAKKQNEISEKQTEIINKQNKIALFEKRYEVFCELFKIVGIGDQLDYPEIHLKSSFLHEVEAIYGVNFNEKDVGSKLVTILTRIKQSEYIIRQSAFLLYCIDEVDIDKLIESLMACMAFVIKNDSDEIDMENHDVQSFIEISKNVSLKYLDKIEAELSLK